MDLILNTKIYQSKKTDNPIFDLRNKRFIIEYYTRLNNEFYPRLKNGLISKNCTGGPGTNLVFVHYNDRTFVIVNCTLQPNWRKCDVLCPEPIKPFEIPSFRIRLPDENWDTILRILRINFKTNNDIEPIIITSVQIKLENISDQHSDKKKETINISGDCVISLCDTSSNVDLKLSREICCVLTREKGKISIEYSKKESD